jgi:hypothetical protein
MQYKQRKQQQQQQLSAVVRGRQDKMVRGAKAARFLHQGNNRHKATAVTPVTFPSSTGRTKGRKKNSRCCSVEQEQ